MSSPAAARALAPPPERIEAAVREVLDAVRTGGDAAVAGYTARWDTGEAAVSPAPVAPAELEAALAALDPGVKAGLEVAVGNVAAVAEEGRDEESEVGLPEGHRVRLRDIPVAAAGIYAPGGRAPYPSSVVMGVVTARAAGVEDVAVCSPPGPDGRVHPTTLGAAALAGATRVHPIGGAQAIAALAFSTESVDRVDVIAGPGNAWVTEAKRQVFGRVGIDGLAGPSDVVVVAGSGADPGMIALDLVAQAEHGPGTIVAVASPDAALLAEVEAVLAGAPDTGAAAALVAAADLEEALAWAERFAPEHLELLGPDAAALAPRVRTAGCVFVDTGTAFGDYVAGSNHVLPTGGAARYSAGLSPRAFRRRVAEVRIGAEAATRLAPAGAALARAEGFEAHARSMEARMVRR